MKKILVSMVIASTMLISASIANSGEGYTTDRAMLYGAMAGRYDILDVLVKFVKAHGNRCDSVSSAADNMFSNGYTLKCNGFKYTYKIMDKGGKWYLEVD
jgi:hypothetical protein